MFVGADLTDDGGVTATVVLTKVLKEKKKNSEKIFNVDKLSFVLLLVNRREPKTWYGPERQHSKTTVIRTLGQQPNHPTTNA